MGIASQHDIGASLAAAYGMAPQAVTAYTGDSSGLNDPQFGASIDRLALARRYLSVKVVGLVNVVLAAASSGAVGRTSTVELAIQDSGDNITFTDFVGDAAGLGASTDPVLTFPAQVTATASSTGTPAAGLNYAGYRDVDISRARRYIRPKLTVNLSATSSGTNNGITIQGVALILGGPDILPAT